MKRNLAAVFISGCVLVCVLALVLGDETYRCPSHIDRSKMYTFRDKCYEFNDHERYWNEARDECKRAGGSLVEVHDAETMEFIKRSIQQRGWQNNGIWIGLTDHSGYTGGDGHQWKWIGSGTWITGSSYTNWAPDQPGTFGFAEDCAIMNKGDDWKWHDKPCHFSFYHYRFICQFNMHVTTTTTRLTTTTLRSTTTSSTTTPGPALPLSSTSVSSISSDPQTVHIMGTTSMITQSSTSPPTSKNANDKRNNKIDDSEPDDNITQVIEGVIAKVKQPDNQEGDPSQSNNTALGLGIGIGLGVLIVCVVVLFVFICRRRRRKQYEEEPGVRFNNPNYGDPNSTVTVANEYHDSEENQYAEMELPGASAPPSTNIYNNCTLTAPNEKLVNEKNEVLSEKRTDNPYEVPNTSRSHYEVPHSPPAYYPADSPPPYEEEPTRDVAVKATNEVFVDEPRVDLDKSDP